jgi:hypothetical protein
MGTLVPAHATKARGGSRGRAPFILNLDTGWKEVAAGA